MKINELIQALQGMPPEKELCFASPGVEYRIVGVGEAKKGQAYNPSSTGGLHLGLPDRAVLVGEAIT